MNMSIDKVIEILDSGKAPETEQDFLDFDTAIETAINLLKNYPDNQPNDPLTLEELRKMDGEPVYVQGINGSHISSGWYLVKRDWCCCKNERGNVAFCERYGEWWLAYRRKPENQS